MTFGVADLDPAAPGFLKWGRLELLGPVVQTLPQLGVPRYWREPLPYAIHPKTDLSSPVRHWVWRHQQGQHAPPGLKGRCLRGLLVEERGSFSMPMNLAQGPGAGPLLLEAGPGLFLVQGWRQAFPRPGKAA